MSKRGIIVLLYHAAFAADYSFSPKFSLRNFSRKKAAFLPPQNLGTPVRPFSAALGRPKSLQFPASCTTAAILGMRKPRKNRGCNFSCEIISLRISHPAKCPILQGFFSFLLLVCCLCKTFSHYVSIFITIDFSFKLLIHNILILCIKSIDFFVYFCYYTFDTQIFEFMC